MTDSDSANRVSNAARARRKADPRKRRSSSIAEGAPRKRVEFVDPPIQDVSRVRTVALVHRAWREALDLGRHILFEAKCNLSMVRQEPRELAFLVGETKNMIESAADALKPQVERRRRTNGPWSGPGERRGRDPLQPEMDAWDEALKRLRGEGKA